MRQPPSPPWPKVLQYAGWMLRPGEYMERCARRLGDVFITHVPDPIIVATAPDIVRKIITAPEDVLVAGEASGPVFKRVTGPHALPVLDGPDHARHRRILQGPFHNDMLRQYTDVIAATTDAAVERWPVGTPFRFLEAMEEVTLEITLRTIWGLEERDAIRRAGAHLRALGDAAINRRFVAAAATISDLRWEQVGALASAELRIGRAALRGARLLPFGRFFTARRTLIETIRGEIERRRRIGFEDRTDVLSRMLRARDPDGGSGLTDEEITSELLALSLAGVGTTATTAAWTVGLLLHHPAALRRLLDELRSAGPGPITPRRPGDLPFLNAAIKESLRLYPIQPLSVGRVVHEDFDLGGYVAPRGSFVTGCSYLTHRRPDVFAEPAAFRPERFLERHVAFNEYFPFGGGPRRCIGAAFAIHHLQVSLARVFSRVRMTPVSGRERATWKGIDLQPARGTTVVMTRDR